MLERLAADQAILAIMSQHRWTVGELTELHPHTDPTLLGLNRNAGQSIALRLLTDRLDGLRAVRLFPSPWNVNRFSDAMHSTRAYDES